MTSFKLVNDYFMDIASVIIFSAYRPESSKFSIHGCGFLCVRVFVSVTLAISEQSMFTIFFRFEHVYIQ